MKKFIFIALFLAHSVSADTNIITGIIDSDTTWFPGEGVYVIDSGFSIIEGVTLTIEPGTIVKAKITGQGGPSIYGNLVVRGTNESPVYFTSIYDDSAGGDTGNDGPTEGDEKQWQGLYFKEGSSGEFNNAVIRYAGYGGFGFGNMVGIENDGGIIKITDSSISNNNVHGIWQRGGSLLVKNSLIEDHLYAVTVEEGGVEVTDTEIRGNTEMGIYAQGTESISLIGNTFSRNGRTAQIEASVDFIHENNTSSDLSLKGFMVNGNISGEVLWHSRDLPVIVAGNDVTVLPGSTLNIEPGTIIKLGDARGIGGIVVHGSLVAEGSSDNKIYFTSTKDDVVGGDTNGDGSNSLPAAKNWSAIFLEAGSEASFDNAVIRYSGFNFNGEYLPGVAAAIYNRGSDLSISDTFIGYNFGSGIFQDAGTTTINKSNFTDQSYGLQFRGGEVNVSQSSLVDHVDQAVYNQSGTLDFPIKIVDARNNWWGSPDGPQDISTSTPTGSGDRVSANVTYKPWLIYDPVDTPTRNPVIIVPGIMGSYLYRGDDSDTEIWMNIFKMLLPGDDSYLDELILSSEGNQINIPELKPTDIIRKINIPLFVRDNFFGLIQTLEEYGYEENNNLFVFPYDWRLDADISAQNLTNKINQIKAQTGADKIDLIAHSMGGLIFKEQLSQVNSIRKFINIGSPHYGAPESFQTVTYGDTGIGILNQERIKIITQNMPSVYQLLPSRKYFEVYGTSYISELDDLDGNGVRGNLDYDQTKEFMRNTGRNSLLVDRADEFHQEIDNLNPADYGVETYNIVGCGTPTLGKIFVLNKENNGSYEYGLSYTNGDGTVPIKSAKGINAQETYYLKNATHAVMPSTDGVKELVASILTETDFDMSLYPQLSTAAIGCDMPSGEVISFHSPINLHIYDPEGNHAGPNEDGDLEINIPGITYDIIDGNKFAFLPDGAEYQIVGEATEEGSFNTRITEIVGENALETRYFNEVPITNTTEVTFTIGLEEVDSLSIDNEGDGIIDSSIPVTSILDSTESQDLTKPETSFHIKGDQLNHKTYFSPILIKLNAIDDNAGVLKTEYSLDNGSTWKIYDKPFVVRDKGRVKLMYKSTDRAGNVETIKTVNITLIHHNN